MPLPDLIEIVPLSAAPEVEITVPGSKSITNRALILAALAKGDVTLEGALWSEDTQVMVEALRRLGYAIGVRPDAGEPGNRTLVVTGLSLPFMALIGVTWAIWEGRFGWWFLFVWTTWVGIGAERLMEVIRLRSRSTGLQPINWDSQQDDARSEICETDHSGDYPG